MGKNNKSGETSFRYTMDIANFEVWNLENINKRRDEIIESIKKILEIKA